MNATLVRAIKAVPFIGKLAEPSPALLVTEGISGLCHYHISTRAQTIEGVAHCGARVMSNSMDLADWGKPFGAHFPKRPSFCKECERVNFVAIAAAAAAAANNPWK